MQVGQWGVTHHEEDGLVEDLEEVRRVGGDWMSSSTPGQREEPRLTDHIQVSADVHRGIFTEERPKKRPFSWLL